MAFTVCLRVRALNTPLSTWGRVRPHNTLHRNKNTLLFDVKPASLKCLLRGNHTPRSPRGRAIRTVPGLTRPAINHWHRASTSRRRVPNKTSSKTQIRARPPHFQLNPQSRRLFVRCPLPNSERLSCCSDPRRSPKQVRGNVNRFNRSQLAYSRS